MEYHVLDRKLVVVDKRKVVLVIDDVGAYTPGKDVAWSYARTNSDLIGRYRRPYITLDSSCCKAAILVVSERANYREYYTGWHICGGIPCYVDINGCVTMLFAGYHFVELRRHKDDQPLPFAAWKFTVGSQSAEILVQAAISAPEGTNVLVRPCQYRARSEFMYDDA